MDILNRLVNSNVDFKNFNFNDEAALLNVLGMTKTEYLETTIKVKSAAARFLLKYNIQSQPDGKKCITCELDETTKINALRELLPSYQNDKVTYENFVSSMSADYGKANTGAGARTQELCCGGWFYACAALCAATIEVFPVYLLCAAYCYHAECCSKKGGK